MKLITTKSLRTCRLLTLLSNGVFLKQITNYFFSPLLTAINTLFSPTKKVCSEISLPKFSTQVIKGKRKKVFSNLSMWLPTFDSKTVKTGFMMDKKGTGIFISKYFGFSCQQQPVSAQHSYNCLKPTFIRVKSLVTTYSKF